MVERKAFKLKSNLDAMDNSLVLPHQLPHRNGIDIIWGNTYLYDNMLIASLSFSFYKKGLVYI